MWNSETHARMQMDPSCYEIFCLFEHSTVRDSENSKSSIPITSLSSLENAITPLVLFLPSVIDTIAFRDKVVSYSQHSGIVVIMMQHADNTLKIYDLISYYI